MNKIFTLSIGAIMLFNTPVFSQINEQFENDSTALATNCWQFLGMNFAKNTGPTSGYLINGIGSTYALPPVSGDSLRMVRTPLLNVSSSINISFKYKLSNTLNGQQTRFIQVALTTSVGVVVQSLATINMSTSTNNTTAVKTFNQTFTVTTPGTYRLSIITGGSTGGGNARISVDDIAQNATVIGCDVQSITLPVQLTSFIGSLNNNKISLQWAVAQNEDADHFEVEKSTDGNDFIAAAVVMTSTKPGSETYSLNEIMKSEKIYYRIKTFDNNKTITFSKTLIFETKTVSNTSGLKIVNNPATDKLSLSFTSANNQSLEIRVFDLAGRVQMNQKVNVYQGSNLISLPLTSVLKTGLYAVEVSNGAERLSSKFVKQ
jgi:hypothetical protein